MKPDFTVEIPYIYRVIFRIDLIRVKLTALNVFVVLEFSLLHFPLNLDRGPLDCSQRSW